jgi:hypothetical protein
MAANNTFESGLENLLLGPGLSSSSRKQHRRPSPVAAESSPSSQLPPVSSLSTTITFSGTDTTFESKYTLRNKLQGGSYGTVYVGYHNVRKREYAVKVVNRR